MIFFKVSVIGLLTVYFIGLLGHFIRNWIEIYPYEWTNIKPIIGIINHKLIYHIGNKKMPLSTKHLDFSAHSTCGENTSTY